MPGCSLVDEQAAAHGQADPRSKVAFDIEDAGRGVVRLEVHHDGFPCSRSVLQGVVPGWPAALSSLQTLLGTGMAEP